MLPPLDEERAGAFGRRLIDVYTGAALTKLIGVGHETGLFEAAAQGPATSAELAARAGLQERYVREWLGAMTTGGVFVYDPASATYELPAEHAVALTGRSVRNAAPQSQMLNHFGTLLPDLVRVFREGGGIPYDAYRPQFTATMDDTWRRIYDEHLVDGFLGPAEGLVERLAAGARVADIGCGTGHAVNVMARAFPRSDFVGYDIARDAVARGRDEAAEMGLSNARFEVLDVTRLPARPSFDVVTAFDAIHDQVDPAGVLARVRAALARDGVFLMVDFKFASSVEDNVGNPFAPLYYGISTMHCLAVSLAGDGAGLGTMWGIQTATRMLHEAGFPDVRVLDSPRPQNCIYVCPV